MPAPLPPELTAAQGGPVKEPVIYTIPDQFYGVAAKAKLAKAAPTPVPGTAVPGTKGPGEPSAPGAAPVPTAKGSKAWLLIPVFAVLILAGLGFAAWWFLARTPEQPSQPTVTLPAPAPEPEPTPAPEPEPAPAPAPAPATTTAETPPAAPPDESLDPDNDSLTNAEEKLYGTGPLNPDTDGDGFQDGLEVINLYNPAGFKPTKLLDAGLVKTFTATGTFELLMPLAWTAGTPGDVWRLDAGGDEGMTIVVDANAEQRSVLDWFLSRLPGTSPSSAQSFTTKSGLEGVKSADGATAAIDLGNKQIAFIRYDRPAGPLLFRTTFTMLLNSFSKKP